MQVALAAFLFSGAGAQPLILEILPARLQQHVADPLQSVNGVRETTLRPSSLRTSQLRREGTSLLLKLQEAKVLSTARDQAGKSRLLAATAPHSGAFLHDRPCSALSPLPCSHVLDCRVAAWLSDPLYTFQN